MDATDPDLLARLDPARHRAASLVAQGLWACLFVLAVWQIPPPGTLLVLAAMVGIYLLGRGLAMLPCTAMLLGDLRAAGSTGGRRLLLTTTAGTALWGGLCSCLLGFGLAALVAGLGEGFWGLAGLTAGTGLVLMLLIAATRTRQAARRVQPVQDDPLLGRLQDLAAQRGCLDVWVELSEAENLPDGVPAAYFGDNRIRIDRRLGDRLPIEQVEAVFLHELAHHAGRDAIWSRWFQRGRLGLEIVLAVALAAWRIRPGMDPLAAAVQVGPLLILAGWAVAACGEIAENRLTRFQERRAHRRAAIWTGDTEVYVAAMRAIHPAWARPPGQLAGWILGTHPPLGEVIDLVRAMRPKPDPRRRHRQV